MADDFITTQERTWSEIPKSLDWCESRSGPGSTLEVTAPARDFLAVVIQRYGVQSILDAPCGDYNWMAHVDLSGVRYLGWDLVPPQGDLFEKVNLLTVDHAPAVDLIICRDFMIHLPDEQITRVLNLFVESGSWLLLTTNHPMAVNGPQLDPAGEAGFAAYWQRPVNLEAPPFNLRRGFVESVVELDHPVDPLQEFALYNLDTIRATL